MGVRRGVLPGALARGGADRALSRCGARRAAAARPGGAWRGAGLAGRRPARRPRAGRGVRRPGHPGGRRPGHPPIAHRPPPPPAAAAGTRPARRAGRAGQTSAGRGGRPGNPDSPAQLIRALAAAGVRVPSTRFSVLREVDHPAIAPLLEYKELSRLHAAHGWAWLDAWVSGGRFRPEYVVGGVVSGRWASHGGGALQIPRVLRRAVVADPGWALV